MKIGQIINGYTIIGVDGKDFSTKGGGLSMWTFVRKAGVDYFMKEFLSPTYPMESSPGSPKLKERKKQECQKFEDHHTALITKIIKSVSVGGNLIVTRDFFRFNAKYYKVTEKVDVSSLNHNHITKLSLEKKLLILKNISHSLDVLHKLQIIHGDLKPSNILIKKTEGGFYTAKLIDFDNSFFEGQPPVNREEVVGDPVYYSPELENYILSYEDINGSDLTCKSDVFALGVIFCQYLTGELPTGVPPDKYPSHMVNNGHVIKIKDSVSLEPELIDLVNSMLLKKASSRPSISKIFNALKKATAEHKIPSTELKESTPETTHTHIEKKDATKRKVTPELNTIKKGNLTMNLGYKKLKP
jgi:serine/threonine protein kinase